MFFGYGADHDENNLQWCDRGFLIPPFAEMDLIFWTSTGYNRKPLHGISYDPWV